MGVISAISATWGKLAMLGSKQRLEGKRRKSLIPEILESKFFFSVFPAELSLQRPSSCSLGDLSAVTFYCLP